MHVPSLKRRNLKDYHTNRKGTIIGRGGVIKYTTLCKEKALHLSLFMVLGPLHSTGGLLFSFHSSPFFFISFFFVFGLEILLFLSLFYCLNYA